MAFYSTQRTFFIKQFAKLKEHEIYSASRLTCKAAFTFGKNCYIVCKLLVFGLLRVA